MGDGLWRIGELSRRVGVSPQVLRAWERRYQLLEPRRSIGGYRLYSAEDEERVRRVVAYQAAGHATAEAARLARVVGEPLTETTALTPPAAATTNDAVLAAMRERLRLTLQTVDEAAAQRTLDSLFALTELDTALVAVILPVLADIGERWAAGEVSVAVEHHASNVVQARLLGLARGWDEGGGPLAVLACAPGELHALGLLAFGLLLRRRGWRITYLGPDMPLGSLAGWVREYRPAAVVISAVVPERFVENEDALRAMAATVRLILGGAGAGAPMAERIGALALGGDPASAAQTLSELAASGD